MDCFVAKHGPAVHSYGKSPIGNRQEPLKLAIIKKPQMIQNELFEANFVAKGTTNPQQNYNPNV